MEHPRLMNWQIEVLLERLAAQHKRLALEEATPALARHPLVELDAQVRKEET